MVLPGFANVRVEVHETLLLKTVDLGVVGTVKVTDKTTLERFPKTSMGTWLLRLLSPRK